MVRIRAADSLIVMKSPRALEALIAALGDAHWSVRHSAAEALAALKEPSATKALISALETDKDNDRREHIAALLGAIGDTVAVDPLIAALMDKGVLRWYAAHSLGQLGDRRAVEPLIAILAEEVKNTFPNGTREIAWALGQLGHYCAVEPLTSAMKTIQRSIQLMVGIDLAVMEDPITWGREAIEAVEEALRRIAGTNPV